MKTDMVMLPNGNYEKIISPIQHKCEGGEYHHIVCVEYGWDLGNLHLNVDLGDCSDSIVVKCCPLCGYDPKKS